MNLKNIKSRARNYLYYRKKTKIFKTSKSNKRILYFGIPMHTNLGDQAQKYCIRNWIKENYPEYEVLEIPTRIVVDKRFAFLKELQQNVRLEDIIIFQSGYCTHDLEPSTEDLMHRIVISNFPDNRILMLPQTVYFRSEKRKKLSSEIYNMATRMLFLARDRVSYEIAQGMFPKLKIQMYPDIVTTLIGTKAFTKKRNGIFLCTRRDCEKYYSDEEIAWLEKKLSEDCNIDYGDTTIDDCDPYWLDQNIEVKLNEIFEQYASYRIVITDRYHGTIFSLIAGTPVIVVKTHDHKVSTGVEWFKGIYDYVYFADSLENAYVIAKKILGESVKCRPEPYFKKEYYDHLRKAFEEATEVGTCKE